MNQMVAAEKVLPEKMGALTIGTSGGIRAIVPSDLEGVARLASLIVKSELGPKDLDTPEKVTIALLHGMEIGLPPMMAIQRIAVINGRPSIWGDAAIGLVRASGLCEYIHESIDGAGDNRRAVCATKRRGEPEKEIRTYSVADAKRAGLWEKRSANGRPTPWVTHPDRMLQMRARGYLLRDIYSDVLGGLYIAEELQGEDILPPKDITPPSPPPAPPPAPPAAEKHAQAEIIPPSPKKQAADDLEIPPNLRRTKAPSPPHDADGVLIDDTPLDTKPLEQTVNQLLEDMEDFGDTRQHTEDWRRLSDREISMLPPAEKARIEKAYENRLARFEE